VAKDRVRNAALLLAGTFQSSVPGLRAELGRTAADSAVQRLVRANDAPSRIAAERFIAASFSKSLQVIGVEILDKNGQRLLWVDGPAGAKAPPIRDGHVESAPPRDLIVGPIVADRGILYHEAAVPILTPGNDTIGRLVQFREVSNAQSAQLIAGLIGSDATLLFTSPGGKWNNMAEIVPGPPLTPNGPQILSYTAADGSTRLGAAASVGLTPWVLWVDIRTSSILAPARRFLGVMVLAGLLILIMGAIGAWFIGRQITAPLHDVVLAATDISTGDYTRRVSVKRNDELGLLADSFNDMAREIERAHRDVEGRMSAIRESQDRLQLIFDHVGDALFIADDAGHIIDANPAACVLGNQSLEQMKVHTMGEVLPDDGVNVLDIRSAVFAPGVLVHTVRDLTRQRKLEDQLIQAQKMEAVGQLAGGIAHDFNNLLTVIMSYSSMLLIDIEEDNPIRGDIQEISAAAARAATLTRQLLAFSRKQVLQMQAVNVNDVVADVEKMLRRLIGEDISLTAHLAPDLARINGDPGQLEQVLINLAVNARDAMPNGGELTIATGNVDLSAEHGERHMGAPPGKYVMLAITDTGGGMTKEVQQRLFEPFYTTKGPGKGTGLGLSTVHGIVKQSGGDVYVYSELGHGTTFKVYFPRLTAAAEQIATTAEHAVISPRGSETILLAEDDEALRALGERVLTAFGYNVLVARTGAEALRIVAEHKGHIDLVATDVVMPEMNGSQLVAIVLKARPGIRVLFMSGYTDDEVVRRGVIDGQTAFLQKPFTPDLLAHKVRQVLDLPAPATPSS
jgi:signal transduction histidine kinase/CheY-like chemotaxis protein